RLWLQNASTFGWAGKPTHWALRNLSTCQYVREDSINIGTNHHVGLAQALSFRCGWSQDDWYSTRAKDLHKGRWAGDRLDIVEFDADADWAKEWYDVSQEVGKDIRKG